MCHVASVRVFVSLALYTFPWNKTGIHNEVVAAKACGMGLQEKLICNSPAVSGYAWTVPRTTEHSWTMLQPWQTEEIS